ncbi:MAG: ATP synthase F1 subunit gamma [Parachlamydia sp.]|jgi:F-type H+-transporting ATPase subunit gamma|nr:ATP synthase F1 subunit gamma [Parachlamydia sp.]
MTSLRDIRRRLNSIKNIQQLTKAMEMVAASRLHQVQQKIRHARPYVAKIKEILDDLNGSSLEFTHPLLEQREVKKIGVVIIGADMGLSGSYNKDIFSAANKFLLSKAGMPIELLLVGKKAFEYFSKREWPIFYTLPHWGEKLKEADIKTFASQLVSWYTLGNFDEIWFVYTHYVNMMSRKVLTEKFLNLAPTQQEKRQNKEYLFEPSAQDIFSELLLRYCLSKVHTVLNEAYASELAARIFAMKTATSNADDMIEKLTLVRNKVRQAGITKEMLEITSGSEGLK